MDLDRSIVGLLRGNLVERIWVYQITRNALVLQLTLQGTKFYKDDMSQEYSRRPQDEVTTRKPNYERTAAARAATKRIRMAMPLEDRKALGLRLFAIYSGQQTQKHYRMRGIFDPCVKAREAKSRKAKLRREAKSNVAEREKAKFGFPESRSKVIVGW